MKGLLLTLASLHLCSAHTVQRITATICPHHTAGTEDNVYLELLGEEGHCRTKLNGGAWNAGGKEIFEGPALGACEKFHPFGYHIEARVVTDGSPQIIQRGFDGLHLCSLLIEMEAYLQDGSSISHTYEWEGSQLWNELSGAFISVPRAGKSLDELLAPNAFKAEIPGTDWLGRPDNTPFNEWVRTFEKIAPTMVIYDTTSAPRVVLWDELRDNQENGNFNRYVRNKLTHQLESSERLVIVTHGWNDGKIHRCEQSWVAKDFAKKISEYQNEKGMGREKTTTIGLCWNSHSLPNFSQIPVPQSSATGNLCYASKQFNKIVHYYDNAATTGKVGELLSRFITAVQTEYPKVKYVHGMGHSLGAHVMAGIYNFGKVKIDRISGLDPAGPCFEGTSWDINVVNGQWGLHKDCAVFVDNFHTDRKWYGTFLNMGDLDFMVGDPNKAYGGGAQPTCAMCVAGCCHSLARNYYLNSITEDEKEKFLTSYLCNSQDDSDDEANNVGPSLETQRIYAGYHADVAVPKMLAKTPAFQGRMFLPIFGKTGKEWHPVCDSQHLLTASEKKWCMTMA